MDLKSMKLDKKEKDEYAKGSMACERPDYPWGLSINLDDESLEKLGVDSVGKLPKVGDTMLCLCRVKVQSVSSSESASDENGARMNACLQITDFAWEPDSKDSAEEKLYGKA